MRVSLKYSIALGIVVALAGTVAIADAAVAPSMWSRGVTRICAHALLFEGTHEIGTRAGAVAVARDIRSSTERRLARVAALPAPPLTQRDVAARWIAAERRLAAIYAGSYLGIFDVIAAPRTPDQQAEAARLIARLLQAPDRVSDTAARLEGLPRVPDCTGGSAKPPPSNVVAGTVGSM
jgi:hypothetical protein